MSIGIYDADMAKYLLVPFNLDAMKISAYYKRKREMVLLAKEFDPERNKTFFYVKDWDDGEFDMDIHRPNTTYRGHAFSGATYIPLDEAIERMPADTSLYLPMEKRMTQGTNKEAKVFQAMMKAEHCRLSLDGKTVWPHYMSQFQNLEKTRLIMIHDYDIARIDGAFEAVQNILSHCKRNPSIGLKFTPHITDADELLQWSSLRANDTFYSMGYEGVLPNDKFAKWCQLGQNQTTYSALEYNITPASFCENDFTEDLLRQIFRQIIISRSYRLKISLIFSDEFFVEKKLAQLLNLFNFYQHSLTPILSESKFIRDVQTDTLYDFAKATLDSYGKYPKMINRWDMRALFHWAQEKYPTLFKEFYELTYIKLQEEMI